ncbi:MAG TPA: hypothetical protein VJ256_00810 [Dehalococcoidia bacterium]|nr:hypothetical protein [Dehalococcoidia bacterium]
MAISYRSIPSAQAGPHARDGGGYSESHAREGGDYSERASRRPVLLWALAGTAMAVAAFFAVAQSSHSTAAGLRLRQWESVRDQRRAQVYQAEALAAQLSSLDQVARGAGARFGMAPPKAVDYLEVSEGPVPPRAALPHRFRPSPPAASPEHPWWARLRRLLPLP